MTIEKIDALKAVGFVFSESSPYACYNDSANKTRKVNTDVSEKRPSADFPNVSNGKNDFLCRVYQKIAPTSNTLSFNFVQS